MSIGNEALDIPGCGCQKGPMDDKGIEIRKRLELNEPLFIAGFDGWGNALDVSQAMVQYLIRKLNAKNFARINSDLYYRYDDNRPIVAIKEGMLKGVSPPGGSFYAVPGGPHGRDLLLLSATEPNLRWFHFTKELFFFCRRFSVKTIVTLGSMYDNVLHTDRLISGIASKKDISDLFEQKNILPIEYEGPSAIHSLIQSEGQKAGFECISMWCHCPYYLQGTTHFGLLAHLGALLADLFGIKLDCEDLETRWKDLSKEINGLIDGNPELGTMIKNLRKAKVRGSWKSMRGSERKDEKVIQITDFLKPV